jgi:hypothetical protein
VLQLDVLFVLCYAVLWGGGLSLQAHLVDDFLEVDCHTGLLQVAVICAVVNELSNLVEAQLQSDR